SKDTFAKLSFDERIYISNDLISGLKDNDLYHYRRPLDEINYGLNGTPRADSNRQGSVLNLASNDYLNFTRHPSIIHTCLQTIKVNGVGSGSVPMLAGTLKVHKQLEESLAEFTDKNAAITYNSCFAANYGLLTALLTESDIAILDTFVHASIIDGCCKTNKAFFIHNDPDSLKHVLKKVSHYKNKLIIIEGVYSMDGDIARLAEIIAIARENNAWIMIDESHALGVIGDRGKGTQSHLKVQTKVDIISGSLGKAFGGIGGFIAGSKQLISLMELTSRPFIYSTSIPPSVAAGLLKAIELLNESDPALYQLWANIQYFRENIKHVWSNCKNLETAIFPLIINDESKLLKMCSALQRQGIFVNPIFYPVVPKKKSRIRISITAGLSKKEMDYALNNITSIGKRLNII
ncbi:MAG: aminotransferase class I/II-fold pyridoxal phosphate-dependent enzyme, partial [Ignavibacteria bacterium]|nr:aminotransferase class I/II-fold pyridoxal phosphate-dependent enzyme [Ignavibacteria bacterium]